MMEGDIEIRRMFQCFIHDTRKMVRTPMFLLQIEVFFQYRSFQLLFCGNQ